MQHRRLLSTWAATSATWRAWGILVATFCVMLAFQSTVQAQTASRLSCLPGLAHYFGFDEKESGNYLDYMTGSNATCTGCPSPAASMFAGGQRFNGSSSGLNFNETQSFQWGPNSSFTMEMWVKVAGNSSKNQVLIGRVAKEVDMAWWLGLDADGYATFAMRDNLSQSEMIKDERDRIKLNDGKWHHVAIVRDGRLSRSKLYVDGFNVADFVLQYKGSFETASPVSIGYLDLEGMFRFNGIIDELMVYSRDLSEQEMRSRYNSGAGNYCGPEQIAPVITSAPVTYAVSGQDYRYGVVATGKPLPTFSLVSGPQGMAIHASTGALRWTPTAAGTFDVTVKASNSQGEHEQSFRITVKQGAEEKAGMLHHWMLQEASSNRFKDFYTPFDAVAETKNRPVSVKGVVGGGQRFNGKNTGLDVVGSPNFNWAADESFTIELWMRSESSMAGNRVFIGLDGKDSPVHWWLGAFEDGTAAFILRDISYDGVDLYRVGPRINDGSWHQVVAVRDGSAGASKLYVDGEKIAEGRHVYQNDFSSRSPVNIGYMNSSITRTYHYEGDLDEVKLFSRALSDAEIKERYVEVYNGLTEFLSFKGHYTQGGVVLDWQTINEIESNYFDVERSEDGEQFASVGQVKASGTTSSAIAYTFTDETPLKEQGYYRLRMNRLDGTFIYSQAILIQDRSPISSSFKVYPNPAAGGEQVTIEISNLKENEEVTFMVTDVSGKRVYNQQIRTNEMGELYLTLPIGATMRPGIYNLTVMGSNKMLNRKLVVGT